MIERLGPVDASRMARLEQDGAENPWNERQLTESLGQANSLAWGEGDAKGVLAGHLLVSHLLDEAEVLTLVVHPTRRRQGLGRALLERAFREVARPTWHLEVRSDNLPAIALYEQLGFCRVGLRRGYYRQGQDALLMSRRTECG